MATYYIVSATASDGDGSEETPFKYLSTACALATGAHTFEVTNNGWTAPYRYSGAGTYPFYPGGSIDGSTWNFNGAIVTASVALASTGWTLWPGSANVYYIALAATPTMIFGRGTGHWLVDDLVPYPWYKMSYIPADSDNCCWYYGSVGAVLFICSTGGSPNSDATNYSGLVLEQQEVDYAGSFASTAINHVVNNGWFFGGKLRSLNINGAGTQILRCKAFYEGTSSVFRVDTSATNCKFHYNEIIGQRRFAYGYGTVHVLGAGATAPNEFYNNVIYGGTKNIELAAGSGGTQAPVFKNNLLIDASLLAIQINTTGAYTEDYNAIVHTNQDDRSIGIGLVSAAHDDPPGVSTSTTNGYIKDAMNGNFSLLPNSPARDGGVDLSIVTDILGNTVPTGTSPDIGAYELLSIESEPNDSVDAQIITLPTVISRSQPEVSWITQAQVITKPIITSGSITDLIDITSAQVITNPVVASKSSTVINSTINAQVITSPFIVSGSVSSPINTVQAQRCTSPDITPIGSVEINDCVAAMVSSQPVITTTSVVDVNDTVQGMVDDGPPIAIPIIINNCINAMVSSHPDIVSTSVTTPNNTISTIVSDFYSGMSGIYLNIALEL